MPTGSTFQIEEEKVSPSQSCTETVAPVEWENGQPESGSRRTGSSLGPASRSGFGDDDETMERSVRPCAGAQGPEDVEMNSGLHSRGRTRCHSSSTNRSPGSMTGSSSTKSMTSTTDSSSYVLHSTRCSQRGHRADCSDPAEQGNHTHRKIMQTVQEMKKRLPSEKMTRIKPSTVQALNYALNCVKQVQANSEYYKLLMCNGLEERKDAAVCTLEQLESITSEHALKNTDTFVVVFSLATGRVVYASEQASSILNCKRKFLDSAKFVELLFHQDVNVFYSHTAQSHLPPWNIGTDSAAVLFKCAQVKSFFCRIRGGKDRDGEMRYNPFRITPYLQKVQGLEGEEEHPCCLALVERIISGYEAPRIPVEKRIFTTTHSPGCVFLEVDDRAVPLLGYLPQDLIGTSVLTCLHPEDCTLMLTMHRKILKFAGQPPFEHSPIRFRCQNGDYITLDTSWSSFVNPWSRKVAFIIGRHKVRTGPLNEDVFAAQNKVEPPVMYEDIKELQSMIYKLFLQPVHTNGSSGYSSLGSNGSHEHYISVASSSDSNGNLWEDSHRERMTLQQICANINKVKSGGQQAYLDSRSKLTAVEKLNTDKQGPSQCVEVQGFRNALEDSHRKQPHIPSYQQINCVDSIIRYLESCSGPALKRKSGNQSVTTSSSSTTSEEEKTTSAPVVKTTSVNEAAAEADAALQNQISGSSAMTVVHTTAAVVGAPLTDITLSTKAMSVMSITSQCSYSSTIVHVPQPESEVTALEDAPMGSEPAEPAPALALAFAPPTPSSSTTTQEEIQVLGLTKEVLSAHTQKEEQEYVDRFRHRILESPFSSYLQQDNSSMAHSVNKADNAMRQSAVERNRSHLGKTRHKRAKPQRSSDSNASPPTSFLPGASQTCNNSSLESSQPKHDLFSPIMMPVQPPYYPPQPGTGQPQGLPQGLPVVLQQEPMQVMNPFMSPVVTFIMPYPAPYTVYPPGVPGITGVQGLTPAGVAPFHFPRPLLDTPPHAALSAVPPAPDALLTSPVSSPWPDEDVEAAQPTALFSSSRSSSPLQLNLLQEELPKPIGPQSSTGRAESLHEKHSKEDDAPSDSGNQDAQSTSSGLLDLLHEDARSGTGSNASGSGSGESGGSLGSGSGLGSNGTTTSHTGSSNSSKYFASNDSSDTSRKGRKSQETAACAPFKCVEDSLWTMIQHTPEPVMMTYQIHPRDQSQVLKEDREKLLVLQPMQPWFSQEQKEELAEVHSWIHQSSLPEEINTQGCVSCNLTALEEGDGSIHSPDLPSSSSPLDCLTDDVSPITDT